MGFRNGEYGGRNTIERRFKPLPNKSRVVEVNIVPYYNTVCQLWPLQSSLL
ncbi:UNVERIFIED_CONTAM: hypothetical protein FKN15_023619 [Acipenser sinensis]